MWLGSLKRHRTPRVQCVNAPGDQLENQIYAERRRLSSIGGTFVLGP